MKDEGFINYVVEALGLDVGTVNVLLIALHAVCSVQVILMNLHKKGLEDI